MRLLMLFAALCVVAQAQTTFQATMKRSFWPDQSGELRVTDEAIEFHPEKDKEIQAWRHEDIQTLDRVSRVELRILTYEGVGWKLGRARRAHFTLESGEFTDAWFAAVVARIGRPATDRVVDNAPAAAERLPAKHLHALGGCQGELVFGESAIFYVTDHAEDAREWRIARDVESVWALNRYRLEISVNEVDGRAFSRTKTFRFQLKEPLDPERYRDLKLRLYGLRERRELVF